ncbi:bifunctional homocysteine S-methyltransferase/methylenetetrahydrofolate reductase [Sulfidibacter corallicola]|uniref:Bifunctional homocysteine S-methyltransferase/methylenetetrahydrofolate reductase n=1 Tax=Sulfidibacter corallicola TaxID=2818388 RepID=A0A8A4TUR7_SULCO|nr:bifunctional homocysteine S-methyltransferase/methylenetetrahydrofolate reductase [Sulfidibacter corallicola]QTD52861.1 bifunctional homocysteine S-methyltransferase/methylenetetrahydrofolate reductase [Sulfidibacter corallicola]
MLRTDYDYLIQERVLVIEGNMTAELSRRSRARIVHPAFHILEHPDLVRSIHQDFAVSGAHVLVTATAESNRLALEGEPLRAEYEAINRKACEICRAAASAQQLVLGGLGPTGALLRPYGRLTEKDYRDIYKDQASLLLDAEVAGFILEGFSSLIEAEQCVLALRELSACPIVACMTFLEDGCTQFGDNVDDCFSTLMEVGADTVGIQGTLGPLEIEGILAQKKTNYPLCVRPNAGYPVHLGNTVSYLSSPEYVAECAELFLSQGAVMVGGAAGFTPDHIRAVADRVRGSFPQVAKKGSSVVASTAPDASDTPRHATRNGPSLCEKLGKQPILSVELEPPRGMEIESLIATIEKLKPYGLDAINIPENPLARARISSIALAKVIRERTQVESIAHITCRDRNLISLQAELLGAHVLGVRAILALTGDPARIGDYPSATSIFDVNSLGLVEIMSRMNLGKDFGMNDLGEPTRFQIGVAANPLAENLDEEMRYLEMKIRRGAHFVQTQPIFDPAAVAPFLQRIAPYEVPVLFGVMLVRDFRHAKFLNNEYPGIHIREADMARFQNADESQQAELGIRFAAELINELRPMSGGVYVMPSFGEAHRLEGVFEKLD